MIRGWKLVPRTIVPALVGLAILVPLYGDPQFTPVTHTEWARMLVRALEIESGLPANAPASFVFQALSWKSSLNWYGDQYASAEGVVRAEGTAHAVTTTDGPGEVQYRLAVIRSGDYSVRMRARGAAATPVELEISPNDTPSPIYSRTLAPSAIAAWAEGGATHLDRGIYSLALLLPPTTIIERIEVSPSCLNPIEPPGGWQALFVAQTGDVAATALQALGWESELPPAELPKELTGADFLAQTGAPIEASAQAGLSPQSFQIKAGKAGLRATVMVDLPVDGLYTLSYFGELGRGLRFMADSCFKAVLCPPEEPRGLEWYEILTARLGAGRHVLSATLASGAAIQRLRIERKRDGLEDYVATLRRLGFDVGPPGPITRGRAIDCMNFIREQRRRIAGLDRYCGDQIEEEVTEASKSTIADSIPIEISGPTTTTTGGPSQPPPIEQPPIPVEQPASPVIP